MVLEVKISPRKIIEHNSYDIITDACKISPKLD